MINLKTMNINDKLKMMDKCFDAVQKDYEGIEDLDIRISKLAALEQLRELSKRNIVKDSSEGVLAAIDSVKTLPKG